MEKKKSEKVEVEFEEGAEPSVGEILGKVMEKAMGPKISDHFGMKEEEYDKLGEEVYGKVMWGNDEVEAVEALFKDVKDPKIRAKIVIFGKANRAFARSRGKC